MQRGRGEEEGGKLIFSIDIFEYFFSEIMIPRALCDFSLQYEEKGHVVVHVAERESKGCIIKLSLA